MSLLRKSMLKNKKGQDYYDLIIAMIGLFLLGSITFGLFTKQYQLSGGLALGTEQFRLLKTYAAAEKALLFVDDAAKLALQQAAYDYGKSGFHASVPDCGSSGSFNYWAKDDISSDNDCVPQPVDCYPEEDTMKLTLTTFFTPLLSSFISSFKSGSEIKIPFNYEPFAISDVVGRTEVVGKSKEAVTITIPNVKYEVKPSFRESIPVDVIADGKEVVANSQLLAKLSKDDTEKKMDEFSKAGKFGWKLVDYTKPGSSCTYDTGNSCTYVCGKKVTQVCEEWCEEEPDSCCVFACDEWCKDDPSVCCKIRTVEEDEICSGTTKTTVSYDEVGSLVSAAEDHKLLIYNEDIGKPEFKNLEYGFGLSWIETKGSSDTCS